MFLNFSAGCRGRLFLRFSARPRQPRTTHKRTHLGDYTALWSAPAPMYNPLGDTFGGLYCAGATRRLRATHKGTHVGGRTAWRSALAAACRPKRNPFKAFYCTGAPQQPRTTHKGIHLGIILHCGAPRRLRTTYKGTRSGEYTALWNAPAAAH